ncbi:MAG: Gfo/Idh/MocA family oxidoreductase [Clostridia bacterium]|nr:Gfo/Idh/MocA family oxidoreductase [Clostridia bacterium]
MKKLRIGILGASRGMDFAKRILADYEFAELAAVCEAYPVLQKKTADLLTELGICAEVVSDFDAMLDCGIDAVIIANYANEHCEYAIRALKRGVHVYSEVQPVQTLAEACALCDAVEESGCIYSYGENYAYSDAVLTLKQTYEQGVIGEAVCLEGTFINDCSPKWHLLTRGIRDHWRNYVPSTFYCTHSIAPIFFSTGRRAVRVNGLEIPRMDYMAVSGARSGSGGMEVMELDNGGIAKSMNGNYRHPFEASFRLIGSEGSFEGTPDGLRLLSYKGGFHYDNIQIPLQTPQFTFRPKREERGLSGGDLNAFGYFIGAILGDQHCRDMTINVYRALDMALPGLLAFRSIADHGMPYAVPDLRDLAVRDAYRNDRYCTDPRTPTEYLLPTNKNGTPEVDEAVYDAVKERFAAIDLTPGMK